MPGVPPQKPTNQISLVPNNTDEVEQPRQPQNLQGLLRYAVEAGAAGAAAQRDLRPLEEERKQFLEEALQSMTIDVISLMKKQIEILNDVSNVTDEDLDEKLNAFETILEYVCNIDIANDFHKINGFSIFDPCIKCNRPEIRAAACDLIAELAQNNPYIQSVICDCTDLMATLLKLLGVEKDHRVQAKAVYAISSITRESEIGYKNFKHHNGLLVMKNALVINNDKVRTKIAFFLSALHSLDKDVLKAMIDMELLEFLVLLMVGDWTSSHEHILALMYLIVENEPDCREELRDERHFVKSTLQKHLDIVQGKDEYQEEESYCRKLLKLIFP